MKSLKNSRLQPLVSLKSVDLTRDWYGRKELKILKGNGILEICALLRYYAADSGNGNGNGSGNSFVIRTHPWTH